jgi:hypothetical protein
VTRVGTTRPGIDRGVDRPAIKRRPFGRDVPDGERLADGDGCLAVLPFDPPCNRHLPLLVALPDKPYRAVSAPSIGALSPSNFLHKTYAPVQLVRVRKADAARKRGRAMLRDQETDEPA